MMKIFTPDFSKWGGGDWHPMGFKVVITRIAIFSEIHKMGGGGGPPHVFSFGGVPQPPPILGGGGTENLGVVQIFARK